MNQNWKAICAGISKSLLNIDISIPEDVSWDIVFEESKKQSIAALAYDGLYLHVPSITKDKWKRIALISVANSFHIVRETGQLSSVLINNSIPTCILKGTASAVYYPQPLNRTMGDVDFIVPAECFDQAKVLLCTNGYVIDKAEENNPRHLILRKNGIVFEMHHYFGYGNDAIDSYIERCWQKTEIKRINDTSFPMLPSLENGLILLVHLKQHLYEGVGIRQLLDWMMYVNEVLDDDFWYSRFQNEARLLGIEQLAIVAAHLCQMYLGLSKNITWCSKADESICDHLFDNIIRAGNFGKNHAGGKSIEKTIINLRRQGLFKYLQKAGEYNWKTYHNHHWLKPFAWAYQIGRFIRQGIATGRNSKEMRLDLSRSTERYNLLNELKLLNDSGEE